MYAILFFRYKTIIKTMEENTESILQEAERIINGERQVDYADPVVNFKNIAECASLISGKELTASDCCNVLIAVKLMRERNSHKRDNLVDLCGYAEIFSRIKENEISQIIQKS